MASSEGTPGVCSPFFPQRNASRKTSAEIVSEVRQSLRVQSTQRPFTPRDGHRQLFGKSSVRADADNRPPSAFSLHAQNFDSPESRPGSGTRLSPLNHKPKFPVPCESGDPVTVFPKPPADPLEVRKPLIGPRSRLRRAGSLPIMPPAETDVKERLNPRPEQRQSSAKQRLVPDHTEVHSGPLRPAPNLAQNESSRISTPGVDLGVAAAEGAARCETDVGNGDSGPCTEEKPQSLVWNNRIAPLLQQLEAIVAGGPAGSAVEDGLCDLCERLYGSLAEADMLGRRCKSRSRILRTLFRLIDLNSARLNLHIAKLCLQLCVSGNNLLNICKLIFKLSRSESNDALFQDNPVLDSLLDILSNEDVSTNGEVLLYCVGTLKFLSGNSTIFKLLLDKNCIHTAHKLIQKLHNIEETHFVIAGHILVQLTATLRNLADYPASRPLFVSFGLLSELCLVLHRHQKDQDICTNISRIFSKLSSYSECRLALSQTPGCYRLFLEVLSKHHQKQDLVVRLLFTLGNITAKSEEARLHLFQCEGSVDTLLQLYSSYQRRDNKLHTQQQQQTKPSGNAHESDDVLVKLVRVLANMCIHPAVGPALADNATFIHLLIETLELRSVQESEELTVNTAATVNNLSYYQQPNSALRNCHLTIAKLMMKLLLSPSMDAALEAMRVFGNLTQSSEVRDYIMQSKAHQFVVTLLDSKSTEVCFSACGVLTNLAVDVPNRESLALEGTAAKLVDCLRDLGQGDWQLAGQLCQALWNLAGGCPASLLDQEQIEALLDVLTAYLDKDEALKWIENEHLRDYHKACWELEFFPVAQKLMQIL